MGKLSAAISSDIDSLQSIYHGIGCRRQDGYTFAEVRMGLGRFARFLEPYGIKATLFMVGQDFEQPQNHSIIRAMTQQGHEIANHTMTHAQGFRFLSLQEKERELADMEAACHRVTGIRPVGFRSPGWNVSDDVIPMLLRRGYLYDSSVHPTSLMPLMKLMHWKSMSALRGGGRTTMGHWKYLLAPSVPYQTSSHSLGSHGNSGLIEFPVTVTPFARLPFFATFLLATGYSLFKWSYKLLRAMNRPLQFMFHLSDFVDYSHPDLADQVPASTDSVYVPQALRAPLEKKITLFRRALDLIAEDYSFEPLREWSVRMKSGMTSAVAA